MPYGKISSVTTETGVNLCVNVNNTVGFAVPFIVVKTDDGSVEIILLVWPDLMFKTRSHQTKTYI